MTTEEQTRERRYQLAMHFARQMLNSGMITPDDYKVIEAKMAEKYAPIFGTLLSKMKLISDE